MQRRDFLIGAGVGAAVGAGAVAVLKPKSKPEIVEAAKDLKSPAVSKGIKKMAVVSTWPRDFPGLGTGAQRVA